MGRVDPNAIALDTPKKCSGTVRHTGEPCGNWAIRGTSVCRYHGGNSPQVKKAAARRIAVHELEQLAAELAGPVRITPSDAVLFAIRATAGRVAFWQDYVNNLSKDDLASGISKAGPTDTAYMMLTTEMDRLVKYSEVAMRAGVEAAQVRLAESQGAQLTEILREFLARRGLEDDAAAKADMAAVIRAATSPMAIKR